MEKVTLEQALEWVGGYAKPERFADIRRHLDPVWIEQALEATGTATLRKRRLPAEQVVWLVIGMAMYRDRPIHDLVDRLDLVLPGNALTMAPSAVGRGPDGVAVREERSQMGARERPAACVAKAGAVRGRWFDLASGGLD